MAEAWATNKTTDFSFLLNTCSNTIAVPLLKYYGLQILFSSQICVFPSMYPLVLKRASSTYSDGFSGASVKHILRNSSLYYSVIFYSIPVAWINKSYLSINTSIGWKSLFLCSYSCFDPFTLKSDKLHLKRSLSFHMWRLEVRKRSYGTRLFEINTYDFRAKSDLIFQNSF